MLLHFCPQCGSKLQPGFRFCPGCGEKLPCPVDPLGLVETASTNISQLDTLDGGATPADPHVQLPSTSPLVSASAQPAVKDGGDLGSSPSPVSARLPLHRTRNSGFRGPGKDVLSTHTSSPKSSPKPAPTSSPKPSPNPATDQSPKSVASPRKRRAVATPVKPIREEEAAETTTAAVSSPISRTTTATVFSPTARSPAGGKAKKAKRALAVEPLQEGEELSDTTGQKWQLGELLSQSEAELIYTVQKSGPRSSSSGYDHIAKLGAKHGRIFNEQNFLLRVAKPSSVDKWMKLTRKDFIGLPPCVGFGHAETYRFLIFPDLGLTLQSVMEEGEELLSEVAVLQLACRILDVLEFIHENEYVHADIQAENIYILPTGNHTELYLAGYGHAFRYCPGGKHVEYREGSRTPHEGAVEFISLESHKGAGPSRRSDLQALGYCLLRWHTGVLPWSSLTHTPARVAAEKQRFMEDVPGLLSHCYGHIKKTASKALQSYLSQVMCLQYCDQPDYQTLREGLHTSLQQLGGSLEQPLALQKNPTGRR